MQSVHVHAVSRSVVLSAISNIVSNLFEAGRIAEAEKQVRATAAFPVFNALKTGWNLSNRHVVRYAFARNLTEQVPNCPYVTRRHRVRCHHGMKIPAIVNMLGESQQHE
jgi:hypothetical protein